MSAVVDIVYTDSYDDALYAFPNAAIKLRITQTVDVMKTMLTQPNKASAQKATTTIKDVAGATIYNVTLNLSQI